MPLYVNFLRRISPRTGDYTNLDERTAFIAEAERNLRVLCPLANVSSRDGVVTLAGTPASCPRGVELVRRLVQSCYRIDISKTTGRNNRCDPTYRHGGKTGSTVYWNPQHTDPVAGVVCPTYIVLAHELGHADQFVRGIIGPSDLYPARGRRGFSLRIENLNIFGRHIGADTDDKGITENMLRDEHNVTLRPSY